MTVEQNKLRISGETLSDRFPFRGLYSALSQIWQVEFSTNRHIVTEEGDDLSLPDQFYLPYSHNWPNIGMAIEKLGNRINPSIPYRIHTTDPNGDFLLKRQLTDQDIFHAQQEKILHNTSVLCIGGIEGRVLADFGATVVNMDEKIHVVTQTIQRHSLIEIPEYFTQDTLSLIGDHQFDIVMACNVIDRGSGLDTVSRRSIFSIDEEEIETYTRYILLLLSAVKEDGYIIVNGNMLSHAMKRIDVRTIEIYPIDSHTTGTSALTDSRSVWVIQK